MSACSNCFATKEGGHQMKPLFSIVIANYNYGRFLEDAIESILAQDLEDEVEIIVCDGGSTDNSVEIIGRYADKIAWWCSERDGGQSAAFNKGFLHARGKFLAWLNADDVLIPGALKALKVEIEKYPECEWFTGSSVWCDSNLFVKRVFRAHHFSTIRLKARQLTCGGPSSFFTKRLLEASGGFDESLHFVMDNDLWYRFALKLGVRYRRVKALTWAYRIHEESKMSGCTVVPDSDATKRKLVRIRAERALLEDRYGNSIWWACLLNRIPVSLVDSIVSAWQEFRYSGRHLSVVCGRKVCRVKVLLANAIQEYMTGFAAMSAKTYAPNNWMRKKFRDTPDHVFLDPDVYDNLDKCAAYVMGHGVQVLYAQGMQSLLRFYMIRRRCRGIRPILVTNCHAPHVWDCWWRALMFVLAACLLADGIVFLVEKTRKKWMPLCRLFGLKTWHIPNPVDLNRFPEMDKKAPPGSVPLIGCIGTVEPRKCQHIVLETVSELIKRGRPVKASIVGNYVNEAYRRFLEMSIPKMNLGEFVELAPTLDYECVPRWMSGLDIYLCPSKAEVMPFSILEALASGLPSVGHDVAGIHEEIRDGFNGHLVHTDLAIDYADAIESVLKNYERFSLNSRRLAVDEFSTEQWAKKVSEMCFYREGENR